ncbi:hypothetical protein DSUL_20299 [Desulfovibrionales bacterium]
MTDLTKKIDYGFYYLTRYRRFPGNRKVKTAATRPNKKFA